MSKKTLLINGEEIPFQVGQTILEAARDSNINIPTLCYHKDLSIDGSCRLCMVEVQGENREVASCTLSAAEGMIIQTETPRLIKSRRTILEMLLQNYHDEDTDAKASHASEFMQWVKHYDVERPADFKKAGSYVVDSDPNPFIRVDLNKCILCSRCVRACNEIQGRYVWDIAGRGSETRLVAGINTDLLEARCESCGACVEYCPTGALTNKLSILQQDLAKQVTTTCAYCGVGCNFDLQVQDNKIIGVKSNHEAAVNGAHLCVKGRYGYDFINHADRLTVPRVRRYLLQGRTREKGEIRDEWVDVAWDTALNLAAEKIVHIKRQSGSDALGLMSSAKCTNEENYLMQKFARQVVGTHNIDHCARLCHSSTVAGLAACFGSGAMSNTMADIAEHAKAVLIIGSNTTEQHPVFGCMLRQAAHQRGLKIVVADPRTIDICEFAELHIKQKPGTDVALVNGLMHIILENNWHDADFIDSRTEGFDDFKAVIATYSPERVSEITGVSVDKLEQAAKTLSLNSPMAVIWAMGITQHTTGVMNVLSLGNLQMLLGNMGIAGGGVNPLRGQNNVQGACDMGCLPNVFPAYQKVTDEKNLEKFSQAWATNEDETALFSSKTGLTVTEMISQAGEGEIRGLYILGENPVMTDPDINHVRTNLNDNEFLILQEIFPSETAVYADILLPGVSFAEKDGTFTNTERRIQRVRKAIDEVGDARADWSIISELAKRILSLENRAAKGPHSAWDYDSPSEIMDEMALLAPSYAGVSYERLENGEQLHWPVKSLAHAGTPILHIEQFTCGKGKFNVCEHLPADEMPGKDFPFVLTTGRVLYHWHGTEMTRRSKGLLEVCPVAQIEINPEDAITLGISDGGKIKVTSLRGETIARALLTERVSQGLIFGNFHFPGEQNINNVTNAAVDPIAKIPEYKVCAVKVEHYQ